MKNKFLFLILAIILVIPATLIFTACKNNDTVLNFIFIKYEDGTEECLDGIPLYLGTYKYKDTNNVSLLNAKFNFKIYASYSDGSKVELNEEELKEVKITYKYSYEGNETNLDAFPSFRDCDVGEYYFTFTYKDKSLTVYYIINKTVNTYNLTITQSTWNYGNKNIIPKINNFTETEGNEVDYYFMPADKFEQIKDSQELWGKNYYSYDENVDIIPGKYVLFARVPETKNYESSYSDVKNFEIKTGALKIEQLPTLIINNYYYNFEDNGPIKLENISISADLDNEGSIVNAKGEKVYGRFVWGNPEAEVDTNSSGRYQVYFVDDNNYYAKLPIGYYSIAGKICAANVTVPSICNDYSYYNGEYQDINLYNYSYNGYYTIKINGVLVENIGDDGKIGSFKDAGVYNIEFELKDKTNFKWDTEPQHSNNVIVTYEIKKLESYIAGSIFDNLVLNPAGKVEIKLDSVNKEDGYYFITPYEIGTLNVEFLYSYTDDYGTHNSNVNASCNVEHREDGFDYLIITILSFNEANAYSGHLILHFTATGINNYADINEYLTYIQVIKHDEDTTAFYNNQSLLSYSFYLDDIIEEKTTEDYRWMPFNLSEYGTWVVERKSGSGWVTFDTTQPLLEIGQMTCRIRFKSNNEVSCNSIIGSEITVDIYKKLNNYTVDSTDCEVVNDHNQYNLSISKNGEDPYYTSQKLRIYAGNIEKIQNLASTINTEGNGVYLYGGNAGITYTISEDKKYIEFEIKANLANDSGVANFYFNIIGGDRYQDTYVELYVNLQKSAA